MSTMRGPILVLMLLAVSCKGNRKETEESTTPVGKVAEVKDALAKVRDEDTLIVRRAERNVDLYVELIRQGQTQDAVRVHLALAGAVDRDFEVFVGIARKHQLVIVRNMAVKCLAFAHLKRRDARDALLSLLEDKQLTIIQNAVLGLGILKDKETDLTHIIRLCGSGDADLRTNAATALRDLFLVKQTPRSLTPQYYAAIERLLVILHDKYNLRGRRAAAWAFANMRHPDVLDHLATALGDDDETVQIGGLRGIQMLGDQRGLEPVLAFLETAPKTGAASWSHRALASIAISMGFASSGTELQALGTNPRHWRAWFREQRNR